MSSVSPNKKEPPKMSIRLEVAYRDLLARVDALEKRLDAKTPPVAEPPARQEMPLSPRSREAAKAAAQLVG